MLGTTTAFLAGFSTKAGQGRRAEASPRNKHSTRQAQRLPPGAPCPPCSRSGDLPHRTPLTDLSTVCTKVRVNDAVSNLEKGSGLQISLSAARREAAWLWELCLACVLQPTGLLQQQMAEITTGLRLASNTSSCTQLQLFRKELCGNLPPPHTKTIRPENPCTAATGGYRQSIGRSN